MTQPDEHKAPASADFYVRFATIVVGTIFGGIMLWSIIAPIQGAVTAPGQVIVEGNRKSVQHLEGGVVADILVREGSIVEEGELIVRLDDTVPKASLSLVDGQLAEQYARRVRLEAERDNLDVMQTPRGLAAVLKLPLFAEKLEGQKRLFVARTDTAKTQISLLSERVVQQEERISGLRVQIKSLNKQMQIIAEELEGVQDLVKEGYATKIRENELLRSEETLRGERGSLVAAVAESQSVISEAKLEIARLKETRREEAITELREVESSIAESEERRIAAADEFDRTRIRAPIEGRVLGLTANTVGGVIGPGIPLMEIVPGASDLQVSAKIAPADVDKVQSGQSTLVRFSAFGSRRTPETDGTVRSISADSILDEISGAQYYLVIIDLPQGNELQKILKGNLLVPGMPVETFIRTGKRPAISYLLKPLMDSFARSLREE